MMSTALRTVYFLRLGVLAVLAGGGAAAADEPALPDGPGKSQVIEACSSCHAVTQVTSQVRSIAQWAETVEQMIARGAPVSDDDYPIIVRYLGKYFAPAARPTAMRALPPTPSWTVQNDVRRPVRNDAE